MVNPKTAGGGQIDPPVVFRKMYQKCIKNDIR